MASNGVPFVLEPVGDADGIQGPIHGAIHLPETGEPRPAVVVCHGFKGFMDWGFHPYLAELIAARGYVVVRWNQPSSGMRPGDERVTDLEAFHDQTVSADVEALVRVLDVLGTDLAPGRFDGRIALVGHSRGGGIALLGAANPRQADRVRALVTWASLATFDRLDAAEKDAWRESGILTIVNGRTGQRLPIGLAALEDLERNAEALDLGAAASRRTAPWLIVHGTNDETVQVREADLLNDSGTGTIELLRIPEASHTLGAVHPFRGPTPHLIQAMNATQTWLRRHLPTGQA